MTDAADSRFRDFSDDAIQVALPGVEQTDDYSCGVACLLSIFEYYAVDKFDYRRLEKALHATEADGTDFRRIVQLARQSGLEAQTHKGMELNELLECVKDRKPVMVSIQAYESDLKKRPQVYYNENANGHFVVAIGYDADNLYFMDPSLPHRRGYLTKEEFVKRWHDNEGSDEHPNVIAHLGLVIYKDSDEFHRAKLIQ